MTARWLAAFAVVLALAGPALAVNPDEELADPALEARARELSKELRCVVCQNQTIDDSDAGIAKDLRLLVRERIVAGDTDDEVMSYLTDRYGDFVRLRPPFNAETFALWAMPVLVLLAALAAALTYLRRRPKPAPADAALSADEEAQLQAVLDERRKT
ncbi:cytochrome c-type biogenesis protein [Acuticoccus sediminis]|uniref:cytochrome c-type biogenesis protein n=1 Tax=Acuticoccus sediminis TaxID=2184697 RepID=UPI001CFD7AFA|nr:cytochrome c-type biogenesis protein [Acuticoccus sediminis]